MSESRIVNYQYTKVRTVVQLDKWIDYVPFLRLALGVTRKEDCEAVDAIGCTVTDDNQDISFVAQDTDYTVTTNLSYSLVRNSDKINLCYSTEIRRTDPSLVFDDLCTEK